MRHRLRALGAGLALGVVACSSSTPPPPLSYGSRTAAGVPISHDAPIPFGGALRPPSESREAPLGPLLYVVSATTKSAYELDLGRRRFLGPSPVLVQMNPAVFRSSNPCHHCSGTVPIPLPGYPTVLTNSNNLPQQATVANGQLWVAGGDDEAVFAIPIRQDGSLGAPARVPLPSVHVTFDPAEGGGAGMNHGVPFEVIGTSQGDVVALAPDNVGIFTDVAYLIDGKSHAIRGTRELPGGGLIAVGNNGSSVVALVTGYLLVLDDTTLAVEHAYPIDQSRGLEAGLAVANDSAVISFDKPARLMRMRLADGHLSSLFQPSGVSGAWGVITDGSTAWWALPKDKEIAAVSLADGSHRFLTSCDGSQYLARSGGELVVTCVFDDAVQVIDLASGNSTRIAAPSMGFPAGIAAP